MTTFQIADEGYWERKFIAYMHDPLDKVFQIPGHEKRAAEVVEKYGLQMPNEEFWKKADAVAAGFERGQVPSYSPDPNRNGAIDFGRFPLVTHPTSKEGLLKLDTAPLSQDDIEQLSKELLQFVEKDIGIIPGKGGYSDRFEKKGERFAVARFLYTHLVLRFKLATDNVGGLGAFWHRIPADSRFPDHSIWQHNALCSAIYSSAELAGDISGVGLMVFSITPVQQFISKARKLRDYWTGSVLLSWLAFEGLRWVMEHLGPDHVLYPSLVDQPLVNEYMVKEWKVDEDWFLNASRDIASLPNKFLFFVPMNMADSIGKNIKAHINQVWMDLCKNTSKTCISMMGDFLSEDEASFLMDVFERQAGGFWDLRWVASYLVEESVKDEIERLLREDSYKEQFDLLQIFKNIIPTNTNYLSPDRGVLYSVSHSLVQTALASSKLNRVVSRAPEMGEKCHLCGEFEVLHHKKYLGDISASEYKRNTDEFWLHLKKVWDGEGGYELGHNLKEYEKLCAICLTKRMAYFVLEKDKNHILHSTFSGKGGFPSTTEVALTGYFDRKSIPVSERKRIAQEVHEQAEGKTDNSDRYFAILLMDGDNMGKLINGEALAATWESVMHPEIVTRLRNPDFMPLYHENWKVIFGKGTRRLVTPAIHAAISEALGDFSVYGVARIIERHKGALIYAGGDDICAVLPVDTALQAASDIRKYYVSAYKLVEREGMPKDVAGSWSPEPGKLSVSLGKGEGISISAGILLCHHKEDLREMIQTAHYLLENVAKQVKGKNACAIELRKRAGGFRYFVAQWDERGVWESIFSIGKAIKDPDKPQVSSSVVYRMDRMRHGIDAILRYEEKPEILKGMVQKIIIKELEDSGVGNKTRKEDFARMMSDIVLRPGHGNRLDYKPEGLIIASFIARKIDS